MTARPIRYQRQVSDRNGKIFYTSITSLSHISKSGGNVIIGVYRKCVLNPLNLRWIIKSSQENKYPEENGSQGTDANAGKDQ